MPGETKIVTELMLTRTMFCPLTRVSEQISRTKPKPLAMSVSARSTRTSRSKSTGPTTVSMFASRLDRPQRIIV